MFPRQKQRLPTMREYLGAPPLIIRPRPNKMKSVSFSDQGTDGNTPKKAHPPIWAPGTEWIEEGLKQNPMPPKSAIRKYEEDKYPRLKIQTEILELLELEDEKPSKMSEWPIKSEPVIKPGKRETFAEFQARMNTRPDGTTVGDRTSSGIGQAQESSTIQNSKSTNTKITSKVTKAKADDSFIVFKEPDFDNSDLCSFRSKVSSVFEKPSMSLILEKKLEKLFPSTSSTSKWENKLKYIGRNALIHRAQKIRLDHQLGRPGVLQWHPPRKTTGMVLPNGVTVTRGGVQIIKDYPPSQPLEDKVSASKINLNKSQNSALRQNIVAAFPPRASLDKQGKNVPPTKIDDGLTTLTKSMLDGVDACKILSELEQFVPRNIKPDKNSGPK